jgi:hypothetical protein
MTVAERARLDEVVDWARNRLAPFGGRLFLFEHGAKVSGSAVGCGVDHAHLHLASLPANLIDLVLLDRTVSWAEVPAEDPWGSVRSDCEYYFVSDFDRAFVGYPAAVRSQYFRRVIAGSLGQADQWDYRQYPNERNAAEAVRVLGQSAREQCAA